MTTTPAPAPAPKLHPFSILLLYPDYMSENITETYYELVDATDVHDAVAKARGACMVECWNTSEDVSLIDDPHDLAVLLALDGHHDDINPE